MVCFKTKGGKFFQFSKFRQYCRHKGSDCGIVNVNIPTNGAEIGGAFGEYLSWFSIFLLLLGNQILAIVSTTSKLKAQSHGILLQIVV